MVHKRRHVDDKHCTCDVCNITLDPRTLCTVTCMQASDGQLHVTFVIRRLIVKSISVIRVKRLFGLPAVFKVAHVGIGQFTYSIETSLLSNSNSPHIHSQTYHSPEEYKYLTTLSTLVSM